MSWAPDNHQSTPVLLLSENSYGKPERILLVLVQPKKSQYIQYKPSPSSPKKAYTSGAKPKKNSTTGPAKTKCGSGTGDSSRCISSPRKRSDIPCV